MSREDMKHIDELEPDIPDRFKTIKKAFAKVKSDSSGSVFSIDATRIKDTSSTYTREDILQALSTTDETGSNTKILVQASRWLYKRSGEYRQLIHRFAGTHLYRYVVMPKMVLEGDIKEVYEQVGNYCNSACIEDTCLDITIKALVDGTAYTYETVESDGSCVTQFLPADYCRTRTFDQYGNKIVEMNFKYFDDNFTDVAQRELILSQLPEEFTTCYNNCTNRKSNIGDDKNYQWQALDSTCARATTFSLDGTPYFAAVLPELISYMEYKEMDKLSKELDLFTILIQKTEFDKDGNLTVDDDTMNNLISTLAKIAKSGGAGSFTTPYKVEALRVKQGAEKTDTYVSDGLSGIYNSASLPELSFNSSSKNGGSAGINSSNNMSRGVFNVILSQFRRWYVMRFATLFPKTLFDIDFLNATVFNEKDISTLYKDALSLGGSVLYYMSSIGANQWRFARTMELEDALGIKNMLMPPSTSYTTNGDESGRPEKAPEDRSDITNDQVDKGTDKDRAKSEK